LRCGKAADFRAECGRIRIERGPAPALETAAMGEISPLDLVLATPRLRLAAPTASDAAETAVAMTPAVAARLLSWPSPLPEEEAQARIERCREEVGAGEALHFIARSRQDSRFVGWTSAWPTDGLETWELGFWIAESFQGQGLALEAARAVTDHLIAQHRPHRLVASVQPDNARSIAVLVRLGLHPMRETTRTAKYRGREERFLVFERSLRGD
jgi:RimJ/RimL family protein N-acetyltransferase